MSSSMVPIVKQIYKILADNHDTLNFQYPQGIAYGVQNLIPVTPFLVVTMNTVESDIHGAPQFQHKYLVEIIVFYSILQSVQDNYIESMEFAEAIQQILNSNSHLKDSNGNALVTFGMVTKLATGIAAKDNNRTLYRTVTISFEAISFEIMPNPTN